MSTPASVRRGAWAFALFVVLVAVYDLGWRSLHNRTLGSRGPQQPLNAVSIGAACKLSFNPMTGGI